MEYFEFPIILTDHDFEQMKREDDLLKKDYSLDYTIGQNEIVGEALLVRLTDSWLPTEDSYNKALDGEFDACIAAFDGIGTFEVPMSKEKFKKLYSKFKDSFESKQPKIEMIRLDNKDQIKEFLNKLNQQNEQESESEQPD